MTLLSPERLAEIERMAFTLEIDKSADVLDLLVHIASQAEIIRLHEEREAKAEKMIAHLRESIADQAAARADPTMPRLVRKVIDVLNEQSEEAYALAETRDERVAAHGLSLLCEWQLAALAKPDAPMEGEG